MHRILTPFEAIGVQIGRYLRLRLRIQSDGERGDGQKCRKAEESEVGNEELELRWQNGQNAA